MSPSPIFASLNARESGRSCRPRFGLRLSPSAGTARLPGALCPASAPEGTAMLAALSRKHIAHRAGLGRPGARPEHTIVRRDGGEMDT